jgi:hypothetical protein
VNYAALARDPQVQASYAPFLRQGFTHRVSGRWVWGRPSEALSYAALEQEHVFSDFQRFLWVAQSPENDRGHWPVLASEADRREAWRLFEDFRGLAEQFRRMGLLAP